MWKLILLTHYIYIGSAVGDTTYAVVDTLGIKSGIEV
jgi:hypothetical protein